MSEKQKIIERIMELQAEFIKYEQENGINPSDYFNPNEDHPLASYRQEHADLSRKLVDIAHEEKGSHR